MFVHFIALETLVESNVEIIEVAVWKFHLSAITTLITSVLVKTTKYNPLRLLLLWYISLFAFGFPIVVLLLLCWWLDSIGFPDQSHSQFIRSQPWNPQGRNKQTHLFHHWNHYKKEIVVQPLQIQQELISALFENDKNGSIYYRKSCILPIFVEIPLSTICATL